MTKKKLLKIAEATAKKLQQEGPRSLNQGWFDKVCKTSRKYKVGQEVVRWGCGGPQGKGTYLYVASVRWGNNGGFVLINSKGQPAITTNIRSAV